MAKLMKNISDQELMAKNLICDEGKETLSDSKCKHCINKKYFRFAETEKEVFFLSDEHVRGLKICKDLLMIIENTSNTSINLFGKTGDRKWKVEIKGNKIATKKAKIMIEDSLPLKPVLHLGKEKFGILKSGLLNKIQTKYGSCIDIRGQKSDRMVPVYIYGTTESQERSLEEIKKLLSQPTDMFLNNSQASLLLSRNSLSMIEKQFRVGISILENKWSNKRPLKIYGSAEDKIRTKNALNTMLRLDTSSSSSTIYHKKKDQECIMCST